MILTSILRHLLNDDDSLSCYRSGMFVDINMLKRSLMLRERMNARNIPDQHYRLLSSVSFKGINTVAEALRVGLNRIAKDCFMFEPGSSKIKVKTAMQNGWQELVTYIPPLILQAAFLQDKIPLSDLDQVTLNNYYGTNILPNALYTALVPVNNQYLENFVQARGGLYDLHMHFNGSTETDNAWQDYLSAPVRIFEELKKSFFDIKVREQFQQESHLLEPLNFYRLLIIARRLRNVIFDCVFEINQDKYEPYSSQEDLLQEILMQKSVLGDGTPENNFHSVIRSGQVRSKLSVEALMYVIVFDHIQKKPGSVVVPLFHLYILILGLSNRLLVQQTHQHGFEQFQKHTLNGLREFSEQEYANRFLQMHGNNSRNLLFLEGRLSPKDDFDDLANMICKIETGWSKIVSQGPPNTPELTMVAHFIKKEDSTPDDFIRHKLLRQSIWKKADILIDYKRNVRNKLVGIDAAASEFDAPPEVFAPVFRRLARNGFKGFTYHAGEDFFHVISGLRAIYEAITFCSLPTGSRIGHATATAISVRQWKSILGKHIYMHRGEWLDNLVFTYYLITTRNITELQPLVNRLEKKIVQIAKVIYGAVLTPVVLLEAWKMRRFCPVLARQDKEEDAKLNTFYSLDEWQDQLEIRRNIPGKKIFLAYHGFVARKKYETPIKISPFSLISIRATERLQLEILAWMAQEEIIIETLPTSNVRIGQHKNYSEYHLKNWLKLKRNKKPIPDIVIGTDDTGIFATNIYNEYVNVHCYLSALKEIKNNTISRILDGFHHAADLYKFK
jgi:hypothetical protein